jgi:hypothetical protein
MHTPTADLKELISTESQAHGLSFESHSVLLIPDVCHIDPP